MAGPTNLAGFGCCGGGGGGGGIVVPGCTCTSIPATIFFTPTVAFPFEHRADTLVYGPAPADFSTLVGNFWSGVTRFPYDYSATSGNPLDHGLFGYLLDCGGSQMIIHQYWTTGASIGLGGGGQWNFPLAGHNQCSPFFMDQTNGTTFFFAATDWKIQA